MAKPKRKRAAPKRGKRLPSSPAPTQVLQRAAFRRAFAAEVKRIAEKLGVDPSELSKAAFFTNVADPNLNEWSVRKAGNYLPLRKLAFPEPAEKQGLETKHGAAMVSAHVAKVNREHGRALFVQAALREAVTEALKVAPPTLHAPVSAPSPRKPASRTIVAALSDTHFGANISAGEMAGVNEFNWQVAARRLAHYAVQIADYKRDKREQTDLVVQLNGDVLAGQIHNQEWFVDLLTTQFVGALHLLSQFVSYLAGQFRSVRVVATPGNHGRNVGKADKGRATTHKWDSYETMLYLSLEQVLAAHKNVSFLIPESPFAIYEVQGHVYFQTHGDTVVSVGNPGKAIDMGKISDQINRVNASPLLQGGRRLAAVSVGHVHVATVQLLDSGCVALINGCLSGVDPFAQSIGIFSNRPTQLLVEATPDHAVGDVRLVQLATADHDERLEQIVAPRVPFRPAG